MNIGKQYYNYVSLKIVNKKNDMTTIIVQLYILDFKIFI